MRQFMLEINGCSPLLESCHSVETRDALQKNGSTGKKADDRSPPDLWKSRLYLANKKLVMPVELLYAALLKVAGSISIGNKKTLKSLVQSIYFEEAFPTLFVNNKEVSEEDILKIKGDFKEQMKQAEKLGFELFVKPVRVSSGASHIRVRPQFNSWSVAVKFETDEEDLTVARLQTLWEMAGRRAGLGDWRPGSPKKPGPFGMFKATVKEL